MGTSMSRRRMTAAITGAAAAAFGFDAHRAGRRDSYQQRVGNDTVAVACCRGCGRSISVKVIVEQTNAIRVRGRGR